MDGAYLSNGKVKDQWDCVKEEASCEFPWPAKNYACNFCGREFKSAQALGGHMNVHRRDRARLRLLPSWVAENSYPKPNFSLSSLSAKYHQPNFFTSTFRPNNSLSSPSLTHLSTPSSDSIEEEKKLVASCSWHMPSVPQDQRSCSTKEKDELHALKEKKSLVNLELKMGIFEGSNEDLDLELRL